MKRNLRIKRAFAAFLLTVLLAAHAGREVHVCLEDHAHFKAFSGDLAPDNAARESVVERCPVDDFPFYPCLELQHAAPRFHMTFLEVLHPAPVRCKSCVRIACLSLRAPPGR